MKVLSLLLRNRARSSLPSPRCGLNESPELIAQEWHSLARNPGRVFGLNESPELIAQEWRHSSPRTPRSLCLNESPELIAQESRHHIAVASRL